MDIAKGWRGIGLGACVDGEVGVWRRVIIGRGVVFYLVRVRLGVMSVSVGRAAWGVDYS
jgi:hypothetical protein